MIWIGRTLPPNGAQVGSAGVRSLLSALAYVSGRHLDLLLEAIRDYELPVPDYAIADVGTTIYGIRGNKWMPWQAWANEIARDLGEQDPRCACRTIPGFRYINAAGDGKKYVQVELLYATGS